MNACFFPLHQPTVQIFVGKKNDSFYFPGHSLREKRSFGSWGRRSRRHYRPSYRRRYHYRHGYCARYWGK